MARIKRIFADFSLFIRVFQLAILLDKRRFFAALRMTFYVTLNEVKGLLCAISEKLVLFISIRANPPDPRSIS